MRKCFLFLAITVVAAPALAHDLYLIPLADGRVCARIGEEFPESTNGITADRIASFRLIGDTPVPLKGTEEPKQFCVSLPPGGGVVEMTVFPRFIRLDAKDFTSYIHGEQLLQPQGVRASTHTEGHEGRELYSRYAKALVGESQQAIRPIGHTLEIVPERDPATLKPGEPLPVIVLFQRKPLADIAVFAVYAGAKLEGHKYPVEARTDQAGRAVLKLDRPGMWYARLIHMIPAQGDPEVDWRSFFATLVFMSGNQSRDQSAAKSVSTSQVWTLKSLEERLRHAGMKARRSAQIRQPFMSVPARVFAIGSEGGVEIQAYVYTDAAARARDTDKLDPTHVAPSGTSPMWIMPPTLITSGNLALIVLTRDSTLIGKIRSALADP